MTDHFWTLTCPCVSIAPASTSCEKQALPLGINLATKEFLGPHLPFYGWVQPCSQTETSSHLNAGQKPMASSISFSPIQAVWKNICSHNRVQVSFMDIFLQSAIPLWKTTQHLCLPVIIHYNCTIFFSWNRLHKPECSHNNHIYFYYHKEHRLDTLFQVFTK